MNTALIDAWIRYEYKNTENIQYVVTPPLEIFIVRGYSGAVEQKLLFFFICCGIKELWSQNYNRIKIINDFGRFSKIC